MATITRITPIGIQDVWDIEVETDHSYVAQGFINHNSSSSPNLQNQPNDPERRKCFVAGAGKKLVLYDYSGQEANIWAFVTGDEKFKEIINGGKKLYLEVARIAFGEIVQKGTDRYKIIKALVLGLMYGLTPYGFARDNDIDIETAQEMFDKFFEGFPTSARYVENMTKVNKGLSFSVLGRKCHLHPYDRQWKTNALNNPMQCVAGSSLVQTVEHGLQPIQNLVNEDVQIWDGNQYSNATVMASGKKQKCVMTMQNGTKIISSPDHKFLTTNSYGSKHWRKVSDIAKLSGKLWIQLGNEIPHYNLTTSIPSSFALMSANSHTESMLGLGQYELGVWVGRIASDGSVGDDSITIIVAEHEYEIFDLLWEASSKICQPKRRDILIDGNMPLHNIILFHSALARYLKGEGIKYQIPKFILEDKESLRGYLVGMFDGDGTVNKDGAYLTFGKDDFHADWAQQIQVALSLFGVASRVNQCVGKINVRIYKRDMPKFMQEIGFLNSVKNNKGNKITAQASKNDWGGIYGRSIAIKSIETTNEYIPMYDVVNSDTSQFMVDGFISHNSSGGDMIKLAMKKLRYTDFYKQYHPEGRVQIILQVHDEILTEVDEELATEWDAIQKRVMIEVAESLHPGIKGGVSGGIIENWSQKD